MLQKLSRLKWLIVIVVMLVLPLAAQAGGWAVLTVSSLPAEVVVNRPFTIEFAVRQHGSHFISGLSPKVTAVAATNGDSITFQAVEADREGYYTAEITLPTAGQWHWQIDAFGYDHVMPLLNVAEGGSQPASSPPVSMPLTTWWPLSALGVVALIAALYAWLQKRTHARLGLAFLAVFLVLTPLVWRTGESETAVAQQTAVPAIAPEEIGPALFVSKGCITCHQNEAVTLTHNFAPIGPNLTHYQGNPDFLRAWLNDPAAIKPETIMPNLALSPSEIETLITFLIIE